MSSKQDENDTKTPEDLVHVSNMVWPYNTKNRENTVFYADKQ